MIDDLVTAEDIAKKLSCTSRYVRKMAAEGIISCHRVGGKLVRFDLATVLDELGIEKKVPEINRDKESDS